MRAKQLDIFRRASGENDGGSKPLNTKNSNRTIKLYTVLDISAKMYAVNDEIAMVYENIKQRRKDRAVTKIKNIISNEVTETLSR